MGRLERLIELAREAGARIFTGFSNEDIIRFCIGLFVYKEGFEEWICIPGYEYGEQPTIEYLEKVYEEEGYAAIIHDGRLIGFREEKEEAL